MLFFHVGCVPHGITTKPSILMKQQNVKPQVSNVSIEGDLSQDMLQMELTNRSTEALKVYEHSLPWIGWHSLILVAVRADALGIPLAKDMRIDDPGPGTIIIPPGAVLKGNIPLFLRFPDFRKVRGEQDVIVFWSYRLEPIDAPAWERYGGYVLFPKLKSQVAR
ncbi:MAG: hypothetical protein WC685_03805 [Methylobacter sp.]